ncbi:hypothetical protein AMTRI_Chr08g204620 [Amborella trichopoda]
MTKDKFSTREYQKLSQCKIRLCELVHKTSDNAYKLKFPMHIRTSNVLNVKHLILYHGDASDDDLPNSRAKSFKEEGSDASQNTALEYLHKRDKLKVYMRNHKMTN